MFKGSSCKYSYKTGFQYLFPILARAMKILLFWKLQILEKNIEKFAGWKLRSYKLVQSCTLVKFEKGIFESGKKLGENLLQLN